MKLIGNNTKWILFLSSSDPAPEARHIYDLSFGWCSLISAGIASTDIHVYIEGTNRSFIDSTFNSSTGSSGSAKDTADFISELSDTKYSNIVMFVSGHGGIEGLDSSTPIKPMGIVSAIKAQPHLKNAVIYLGQCYAGIFNYLPVGKNANPDMQTAEIVIIGATNLHNSISASTTENLNGNNIPWPANLFLLYVFKWITSPQDIDGDGVLSIMDSYKFAGAMSNLRNKSLKVGSFISPFQLHAAMLAARQAYATNQTNANKLSLDVATQRYVTSLDIRYTQQESWILNAIPAQRIEYS